MLQEQKHSHNQSFCFLCFPGTRASQFKLLSGYLFAPKLVFFLSSPTLPKYMLPSSQKNIVVASQMHLTLGPMGGVNLCFVKLGYI